VERLIAVGDIHGQSQALRLLLGCIEPGPDDQLVFLGDYVDRGPDSPGVLESLIDLGRCFPQTVFLRGNHEQMLLDAVEVTRGLYREGHLQPGISADEQIPVVVSDFISVGGLETLSAYSADPVDDPCTALLNIPQPHLDFLGRTHFYYQRTPFLFVHAGVDPDDSRGVKNGFQPFLLQRQPLWTQDDSWQLTVVHGHTPVAVPFFGPLEVNLDTGAGYGARLTACDLLNQRIWQAETGCE